MRSRPLLVPPSELLSNLQLRSQSREATSAAAPLRPNFAASAFAPVPSSLFRNRTFAREAATGSVTTAASRRVMATSSTSPPSISSGGAPQAMQQQQHRTFASGSTSSSSAPSCHQPSATPTKESSSSSPGSAKTSSYRHRSVVSSFLYTGVPHTSTFRVSIFKRSALVRTYPNLWGACSGSIEDDDKDPREAALRELEEETGLERGWLREIADSPRETDRGKEGAEEGKREEREGEGRNDAVGKTRTDTPWRSNGRNFVIVDDALRTRWEIWPFLWQVLKPPNPSEPYTGATFTSSTPISNESQEDDASSIMSVEELEKLIRLDWEHTEVRFVKLEEMEKMETVTDLKKSVDSVLESAWPRPRNLQGEGS